MATPKRKPGKKDTTTSPKPEKDDETPDEYVWRTMPVSLRQFFLKLGNELTEVEAESGKRVVSSVHAFTVCLAVARNDPHGATALFDGLIKAIDDWNDQPANSGPAAMPFP